MLLAKMGFRTIDDAIGCSEALRVDPSLRDTTLQFGPVLMPAHLLPDAGKIGQVERRKLYGQDTALRGPVLGSQSAGAQG